jgi:hypothetical protein
MGQGQKPKKRFLTTEIEILQVESECQCEREKRAQVVAKETKEVTPGCTCWAFGRERFIMWAQMEARLTKAEKEEIERMKVLVLLPSHFSPFSDDQTSHARFFCRKARGTTGRTTIQRGQATPARIWVEGRHRGPLLHCQALFQ